MPSFETGCKTKGEAVEAEEWVAQAGVERVAEEKAGVAAGREAWVGAPRCKHSRRSGRSPLRSLQQVSPCHFVPKWCS